MDPIVLDYEASKFWLEVLKSAGGAVVIFIGWYLAIYRRREGKREALEQTIAENKKSADDSLASAKDDIVVKLDEVKRDLSGTDSRLAALEKEVAGLPGHKEMGDLYAQVNAVHGDLREVMGKIGGLATSFDTVQRYLLNRETSGK